MSRWPYWPIPSCALDRIVLVEFWIVLERQHHLKLENLIINQVRVQQAADRRARGGLGKPETFKFLGFTFICGRSRQGRFVLKRNTRSDRMRATLK
jgi:hypothetical protein